MLKIRNKLTVLIFMLVVLDVFSLKAQSEYFLKNQESMYNGIIFGNPHGPNNHGIYHYVGVYSGSPETFVDGFNRGRKRNDKYVFLSEYKYGNYGASYSRYYLIQKNLLNQLNYKILPSGEVICEDYDYERMSLTNDLDDLTELKDFMLKYPNTTRSSEIQNRISVITNEREAIQYKSLSSSTDVYLLEEFVKQYPNSIHVKEINERIDKQNMEINKRDTEIAKINKIEYEKFQKYAQSHPCEIFYDRKSCYHESGGSVYTRIGSNSKTICNFNFADSKGVGKHFNIFYYDDDTQTLRVGYGKEEYSNQFEFGQKFQGNLEDSKTMKIIYDFILTRHGCPSKGYYKEGINYNQTTDYSSSSSRSSSSDNNSGKGEDKRVTKDENGKSSSNVKSSNKTCIVYEGSRKTYEDKFRTVIDYKVLDDEGKLMEIEFSLEKGGSDDGKYLMNYRAVSPMKIYQNSESDAIEYKMKEPRVHCKTYDIVSGKPN